MAKNSITSAFLTVSILILLASCRSVPNNPSSGTSAIAGLVLEGPISPVQQQGESNEAPLAGAPIAIANSVNSTIVAKVVSDSAGKFFVNVAAGSYILTPGQVSNSGLPRPLQPSMVQVPVNTTISDTLHYDTGIR
ncbi:MAG TPA: hypothetical protein VFH95_04515 [Candidatus Kapabacteria bacterium]|nr:hypothetical protein [Candidatus Kapabacteria bacterium]